MLGKFLKRHSSKTQLEVDGAINGGLTTSKTSPSLNLAKGSELMLQQQQQQQLPVQPQYRYQRPSLIGDFTEDELNRFADHSVRPILRPRNTRGPSSSSSTLPNGVGYAEVINAGKSKLNEDQAAFYVGQLSRNDNKPPIKYLYIGLFDGHGGPGVAIKASKELHHIVHEGLDDVLEYLRKSREADEEAGRIVGRRRGQRSATAAAQMGGGLEVDSVQGRKNDDYDGVEDLDDDNVGADGGLFMVDDDDDEVEQPMNTDELIMGALESAFWAMDRLILRDKQQYRISGGACAMVALFIFGQLYVANAGDSRACCYLPQGSPAASSPTLKVMSFDFTPETDRQRIQWVAYQRPDLLRHPVTKEKLYNRHVLSRKLTLDDVGKTVMYRDFYMTGWSARDATLDDVRLEPIISGRGKLARLMATMGVARGIGDHGLMVRTSCVNCKDFLTCQPDVRVLDLERACRTGQEYLVMGTDGMWDVLRNRDVFKCFQSYVEDGLTEEEMAESFVRAARGEKVPDLYWEKSNGDLASGDDITTITVNLTKILQLLVS